MSTSQTYQFPFAKYPAVRLALCFGSGIVLAHCTTLKWSGWAIIFGGIMVFLGVAEYIAHRYVRIAYTHGAIVFYLAAIVCFGAGWQTYCSGDAPSPETSLLSVYTWQPIKATGTITQIKKSSSGKYQIDVIVDSTVLEDSLQWHHRYKLRAILDPDDQSLPAMAQLGVTIRFRATVYPLQGRRNPNEFDYRHYLATQGIHVQAGITKIYRTSINDRWWNWSWWRRHTLHAIENNFSPATQSLAKALLIGYKNELPRRERKSFARVGLSHIMAVSGLHVGFIIAPFWFIIPFLWATRWGKQMGLILFCGLLFFYAGLTGFSASVVRASITGGLLTYGRLFYRSRDPKNLTAVAAIIILLFAPNQLFQVGFQLSFCAVYIILLVFPVLQQWLPGRLQHRWFSPFFFTVIVSCLVQFGLYPILSYYFGEFSLIAPLANAVIVPGLSIIIPYSLALLPFAGLLPGLMHVLSTPCRWFLLLLHLFVAQIAAWPGSWVQTPATGPFIFLIGLMAVLFLASYPMPKIRWKIFILFLLACCLQQAHQFWQKMQPSRLIITMLDVGQGDATLITTPSGKNFMIDTGRWSPGYNSADQIIIPQLKSLGVDRLAAVFLSHPHADHIGGMAALIDNMPIDTIYNSGTRYDSKLYSHYLTDAARHHIPVKSLQAGAIVPLDDQMRIYIYGPSVGNQQGDVNEHSLVEEIIYGQRQFLFMGDAGKVEEQNLTRNFGSMIDTDFLKVGHHGSKTSSSAGFLKEATPAFSAVSLGLHNRYHHPNAAAVNRLKQTGTKLYFTSRRGALEFISDGRHIYYHQWR